MRMAVNRKFKNYEREVTANFRVGLSRGVARGLRMVWPLQTAEYKGRKNGRYNEFIHKNV
jgi:hypothetical protein